MSGLVKYPAASLNLLALAFAAIESLPRRLLSITPHNAHRHFLPTLLSSVCLLSVLLSATDE
jgi:hypothetical protein